MNRYIYHIKGKLTLDTIEQGGRKSSISSGYRPQIHVANITSSQVGGYSDISLFLVDRSKMDPGDSAIVVLAIGSIEKFQGYLTYNSKFYIKEGNKRVGVFQLRNTLGFLPWKVKESESVNIICYKNLQLKIKEKELSYVNIVSKSFLNYVGDLSNFNDTSIEILLHKKFFSTEERFVLTERSAYLFNVLESIYIDYFRDPNKFTPFTSAASKRIPISIKVIDGNFGQLNIFIATSLSFESMVHFYDELTLMLSDKNKLAILFSLKKNEHVIKENTYFWNGKSISRIKKEADFLM